jgi:hypothetical protein
MSIIDCDSVLIHLYKMRSVLKKDVVEKLRDMVVVQGILCVFLVLNLLVGLMAKHAVENPRKTWHCKETDRWFKYEMSLDAHKRVMARKAPMRKKLVKAMTPKLPSCMSIVIEQIQLAYATILMILFGQAIMVVISEKMDLHSRIRIWLCIVTSIAGLYGKWDHLDRFDRVAALVISNLLAFSLVLSFLVRLSKLADKLHNCGADMNAFDQGSCTVDEISGWLTVRGKLVRNQHSSHARTLHLLCCTGRALLCHPLSSERADTLHWRHLFSCA